MRIILAAVLLPLLVSTQIWAKEVHGANPGDFDFYVLALSWSPTFCDDARTASENRSQCGPNRSFGFIAHGLWPQYRGGDWPAYCPTDLPSRVPDDLARSLLDIMPSFSLIGHQWRKHGVCSGLNQEDYFALVRSAFEAVSIPPALRRLNRKVLINPIDVESAFSKFNPELDANEQSVTCDNQLEEVRVCLSRELEFRGCPAVDRRGCRRDRVIVPPVRNLN